MGSLGWASLSLICHDDDDETNGHIIECFGVIFEMYCYKGEQ